jgi:hypothetical protein
MYEGPRDTTLNCGIFFIYRNINLRNTLFLVPLRDYQDLRESRHKFSDELSSQIDFESANGIPNWLSELVSRATIWFVWISKWIDFMWHGSKPESELICMRSVKSAVSHCCLTIGRAFWLEPDQIMCEWLFLHVPDCPRALVLLILHCPLGFSEHQSWAWPICLNVFKYLHWMKYISHRTP